jgi:ribosomal protein S4
MRLLSKYKIYTQSSATLLKHPQRIFNFRRSKWKKLQNKLLRAQHALFFTAAKRKRSKSLNHSFFDNFLNKVPFKFWQKLKGHYKKGLQIKNNVRKLFDDNVRYQFFKKALTSKKNQSLKEVILLALVKPLFKIDVLLWNLSFYASSYQARQAVNNKQVFVNDKTVNGNYYLQKGDIVCIGSASLLSTILFNKSLHNFFVTFVEIDYYTKTVVVVKDLNELSFEDLYIVISYYFDLKKFRDYL